MLNERCLQALTFFMSRTSGITEVKAPSECERIQVLKVHNILDTLQEEELDISTPKAIRICSTPVSLFNLVTNSIKFTKANGHVDVFVTSPPNSDVAGIIKLVVRDNVFSTPEEKESTLGSRHQSRKPFQREIGGSLG